MSQPKVRISVGVVVERLKAQSPWIDHVWRIANVLEGVPGTRAWTQLNGDDERATFYAGATEIGLHITETGFYRDNLESGFPKLWVILRPTGVDPPYELFMVTADPTEGEGLTESATDLIETVPMPAAIQGEIAAFVDAHHIEQPFFKRKRKRADPEALGRRPGGLEPAPEKKPEKKL